MNILKEIETHDCHESTITCLKCTNIEELTDFMKEYAHDLADIHIDSKAFRRDSIFIIEIFDCIELRSINIYSVK